MANTTKLDLAVGTQSVYSTISDNISASANASVYVTISDASSDIAGVLTWYTGNGTPSATSVDFEEAMYSYSVTKTKARLLIQVPVGYWKATFVTSAGTGTANIIARVEGK